MDKQRQKKIENWLRTACGRSLPVIILGGSANGLSFVRSLGRRGIPILLLGLDGQVGIYSRFGKAIALPPAEDYPEDWMELLEFIAHRKDSPCALFPTSDILCVLISKQQDFLRRYFRFILPKRINLERIINKRLQYGVAEAAGIPIPETFFPESIEEIRELASEMLYPCILKPYVSYLGRKIIHKKVAIVRSKEELINEYSHIATLETQFMVQEIIPGPDSNLFGYNAFWDQKGREIAWYTRRKLRQFPPYFGDGTLMISVDAPEVASLGRRLFQTLDYKGFGSLEFKFDPRDSSYRLIEINPRTPLNNQLAIRSGVDFPWIGYRYLMSREFNAEMSKSFKTGIRWVNEQTDIQAYIASRKLESLTFLKWICSIWGAEAKAIGAWDDPLPLIVVILKLLRKLL